MTTDLVRAELATAERATMNAGAGPVEAVRLRITAAGPEGDRRVTGTPRVETTLTHIHAKMQLKEKALVRVIASNAKPGRCRADDQLLAFLENVRASRGDDRTAGLRSKTGKSWSRHGMAEASVWFRAAIGRKKNAEARWLLTMICRRGGIDKRDIGAIRILDTTTEFEISERVAGPFAVEIRRPDKEDNIRIEPLGDTPQVRHLRKSGHTCLGAKPAIPTTVLVEAAIFVTRQDRSNPANLTAKAGRNLAAGRISGRKRNAGTSPATLDNRSRHTCRVRKPHSERRQGRIVAADLLPYNCGECLAFGAELGRETVALAAVARRPRRGALRLRRELLAWALMAAAVHGCWR